MTEVTCKDSGINTIAKMRGKKVGVWFCGNEFELRAALARTGWTRRQGREDRQAAVRHEPIPEAATSTPASAMTYNELAQVLETKNPETGKLYKLERPERLQVQDLGTGMLQDGVFVARRLDQGHGQPGDGRQVPARPHSRAGPTAATTTRSASTSCSKNGPTLPKGHQTWQMNEINALIWPNKLGGIGVMDPAAFKQTAKIAQSTR